MYRKAVQTVHAGWSSLLGSIFRQFLDRNFYWTGRFGTSFYLCTGVCPFFWLFVIKKKLQTFFLRVSNIKYRGTKRIIRRRVICESYHKAVFVISCLRQSVKGGHGDDWTVFLYAWHLSPYSERDFHYKKSIRIQFLNRFTDLSLEINQIDSLISFDKNWFSFFK
jgi:hypothetical protein